MRTLAPGRAGNRHDFRSAVRAAEASFLRTFVGQDNNENRIYFVSIEHARRMLTAHDAACGASVSGSQLIRLEGAIACLLCRALRIELPQLSNIHAGFAERRDEMASIGAPDLSSGLAAVQAFALEEHGQINPVIASCESGALPYLAGQAAALYWQAGWYPYVPWSLPDGAYDRVEFVSMRGTNQPEDTFFFMLPVDEFIPPFDVRPGADAEQRDWDMWWYWQLKHFPSQAWIWQGHHQWVPLWMYMRNLHRSLEDDS